MSTNSTGTWRSLVGRVVVVAVAATPALVGVTTASASATSERATKDETTISIRVNDRRVEAGETSKVRGNLNIKKSDGEAGRLVTLEARTEGAAAFAPIGTATAGERGGLQLEVAPTVTTRYRWSYAGDADTRASRSGVARIVVGPDPGDGTAERIKTTLSIRATDRPADGDGDSLVRGKLLARGVDVPNREIRLLARTVGNPFAVVATARTDRDGVVRFPVRPTVKTAYRLRFEGTRLLRPSRSGVVRVGVRPTVTASATPTPINPGESTTVSGLVSYEGAPYVGATVDLLARNAKRHGKFGVVATGITGALGEVSFVQSPTRTTVYRLLVRHTEGTPPRAVSDNVRVVVRTASSLSIRGRTTVDGYAVSGVLRGGGGPIPGRLVSLELLAADGVTWTAIDSARTRKRGKVQFLEPISEGASYRLSFAGGDRFAPSVSGVVVN
jgi:5-hydroxyisourate hydrolase-like protein (transthyretin family)